MSDDHPHPSLLPQAGEGAGGLRSFTLNSDEGYEALCEPRERSWIPNGALPREPRWPRREEGVLVRAAVEHRSPVQWTEREAQNAAVGAVREWVRHIEMGRLDGK